MSASVVWRLAKKGKFLRRVKPPSVHKTVWMEREGKSERSTPLMRA
jgi:hypothetical protein